MADHTPTPWTIDPKSMRGTIGIDAFADNEEVSQIAQVTGGNSWQEHQANAAFIVRAVNAHDALVAALETVLSLCIPSMNWTDEIGQTALEQARAAIALGKGEPHA